MAPKGDSWAFTFIIKLIKLAWPFDDPQIPLRPAQGAERTRECTAGARSNLGSPLGDRA